MPLLEHALRDDDRGAGRPRGGGARAPAPRRSPRSVDLHGAEPGRLRALGGGPVGLARLRPRGAGGLRGGGGHARRPAAHVARRDPARDRARGNGAAAVRATYDGEPGHPVLLERDLFEALRDVTGDKGARNLLLSVHGARRPLRRPRRRRGRGHAGRARRAAGGRPGHRRAPVGEARAVVRGPRPVERVWETLIDVERVAPCLPGAEITEAGEDGTYRGTFSVRLGPDDGGLPRRADDARRWTRPRAAW